MTIKYGIIGCGMMGGEHIRNINLLEGAEVVAVTDPVKENIEQALALAGDDCQSFANVGDLLDKGNCDALVIASPNHTHHDLLMELADSDLPILAEKPLGISLQECEAIANRYSGRAAPVWVAMEYRYIAPVTRLIDALRDGDAGHIQMISIREYRYPFLAKHGDWNRFNENTGGTLVEKCCHFFDLMRLLSQSEPIRIYASGDMNVNHVNEVYGGVKPDILDNAYVVVDFENGVRSMLELCMFAEASPWQERVTVIGNEAVIEARVPGPSRFSADGVEREAEIEFAYRADKRVVCEPVEVDHSILAAGDHHGSTFFQHQKFLEMVRHGGKPAVGIREGLMSVAMGQAAEQSAKTGQAIDFQDFLQMKNFSLAG